MNECLQGNEFFIAVSGGLALSNNADMTPAAVWAFS
jgi:hypothetical protein